MTCPPAKVGQGLPATTGTQERGRQWIPLPDLQREALLLLTSSLQAVGKDIYFSCLQPPSGGILFQQAEGTHTPTL